MKINVLCLTETPSKQDDHDVQGIYKVNFNVDVTALSENKLASMALDIFHSQIPVKVLDDFEFTVLNDTNQPVDQDEDHVHYSSSADGAVDKVSNLPLSFCGDDTSLIAQPSDSKLEPKVEENAQFTRTQWRNAVAHETTVSGYWEWLRQMILSAPDPTIAVNPDAVEYFSTGNRATIGSVTMADVVGQYDKPIHVPEWAWVEQVACFNHAHNGTHGIWEFIVNISSATDDVIDVKNVPEKLQAVFLEARAKNLAYLIFHQGA